MDGDSTGVGRGRKGTVLLDPRLQPSAATEICALLILTNGQWPPRGLLTGRWPASADAGNSQSDGGEAPAGEGGGTCRLGRGGERGAEVEGTARHGHSRGRSRKPRYVHMVYCAATRQEAEVLTMREIRVDLERVGYEVEGINLSAAAASAAVLVGGRDAEEDCGADDRLGAVVDVRFKFLVRAEFLVPGMRMIVRDHAGNISAVGVVQAIPSGVTERI